MPLRTCALVISPGGTAAISMPSEPNFMCSGLVTVAPFFGSTKNTRGFFAAGLARLRCAAATKPNPATRMRTGSASCFPIFISDLLCHEKGPYPFWGQSQSEGVRPLFEDILASKPSAAPFLQPAGRRLERQDARRHGAGKRFVRRQRDEGRAARRGHGRDVGAKLLHAAALDRRR